MYYPDARRTHEEMMQAMRALRYKDLKYFGRTPTIHDDCNQVQDLMPRWYGDRTKWNMIRKLVEELYASGDS